MFKAFSKDQYTPAIYIAFERVHCSTERGATRIKATELATWTYNDAALRFLWLLRFYNVSSVYSTLPPIPL